VTREGGPLRGHPSQRALLIEEHQVAVDRDGPRRTGGSDPAKGKDDAKVATAVGDADAAGRKARGFGESARWSESPERGARDGPFHGDLRVDHSRRKVDHPLARKAGEGQGEGGRCRRLIEPSPARDQGSGDWLPSARRLG
jgi:hypothetical protein